MICAAICFLIIAFLLSCAYRAGKKEVMAAYDRQNAESLRAMASAEQAKPRDAAELEDRLKKGNF